MAQRIKGLEVSLAFASPGGPVEGLEAIQSFEATEEFETLAESYLGETGQRYDDIYRGTTGTCSLHMDTQNWFRFTGLIKDRATRRAPASGVFNITASMQFPNGQRPRMTFENVFFGNIPMRVPEQSGYVELGLEWSCTNFRKVL